MIIDDCPNWYAGVTCHCTFCFERTRKAPKGLAAKKLLESGKSYCGRCHRWFEPDYTLPHPNHACLRVVK